MYLKITKCHPDAVVPHYATEGAAGLDVSALETVMLQSGCGHVFDTGLKMEIPEGYAILAMGRSGLGFKHGVRLANCTGLIDCDYRGKIMVKLHNEGTEPFVVEKGMRIAQLVVIPYLRAIIVESDELSATERGEGGFGSTGIAVK